MCACHADSDASSKSTCETVGKDDLHCTLNQSKSYIETLRIKPIAVLREDYEVLIRSQLLNAKDPDALQVRYCTIVSGSALRELRDLLNLIIID